MPRGVHLVHGGAFTSEIARPMPRGLGLCLASALEEAEEEGGGLEESAHTQCYAGADETKQCIAQKEDYLECLHRTKEVGLAKEGLAGVEVFECGEGGVRRRRGTSERAQLGSGREDEG